jgi:hypothetical protein
MILDGFAYEFSLHTEGVLVIWGIYYKNIPTRNMEILEVRVTGYITCTWKLQYEYKHFKSLQYTVFPSLRSKSGLTTFYTVHLKHVLADRKQKQKIWLSDSVQKKLFYWVLTVELKHMKRGYKNTYRIILLNTKKSSIYEKFATIKHK